jgi:DNA (cytosine-5)-methyltransferase 1
MENVFSMADLFCGAGGEGTGMIDAVEAAGRRWDMLAVNHWDLAIETHSRNHPNARHLCENLQSVDPVRAVPGRRLHLLWASPECTHHSNARGGRPRSDQSRASAWLILKWLQELYVEHVIIENVPEFLNWGPLDARGRALPKRRGETFLAFVNAMRSLGYRVDWRVLNAADYGAPTTRRRLFVQARRVRGAIQWPMPSHAQDVISDGLFGDGRRPWVPAREIIDWSVSGESIFHRKRPLADATLERIECGIRRYWGEWAEPFLVVLRGTGTARGVNVPLPAVTAGGQHLGLVQPFMTRYQGGDPNRNYAVDGPVPTLDCSNRFGLVEPFIYASGHRSSVRVAPIAEPLSTVVTKAEHCLIEPFLVKYYGTGITRPLDEPLDTVTSKDRFGLVQPDAVALDIRFRMLLPRELAGAQGFPAGYWFAGNQSDQVRQIGNAVPCPVARALAECVVAAA